MSLSGLFTTFPFLNSFSASIMMLVGIYLVAKLWDTAIRTL